MTSQPAPEHEIQTIASQNDCICSHSDHADFEKHHLQHTQQKEEFLMTQYSNILGILQKQYLKLSSTLLTELSGSYEEDVLEGVLDHLRDAMTHNQHCVNEARRKLWTKFRAEEVVVAVGAKGEDV